ncbi:hypothetical protein [Candidatus Odyssella thessalonicensis]|uniref:hypothetical protein n=1 Tax=Candidatus Odyssella thessalonicensis TaxID=84647 RepID=UPI000225B434|nr:hypothetical protein [Candidatus Odyssella thessalonicensis]
MLKYILGALVVSSFNCSAIDNVDIKPNHPETEKKRNFLVKQKGQVFQKEINPSSDRDIPLNQNNMEVLTDRDDISGRLSDQELEDVNNLYNSQESIPLPSRRAAMGHPSVQKKNSAEMDVDFSDGRLSEEEFEEVDNLYNSQEGISLPPRHAALGYQSIKKENSTEMDTDLSKGRLSEEEFDEADNLYNSQKFNNFTPVSFKPTLAEPIGPSSSGEVIGSEKFSFDSMGKPKNTVRELVQIWEPAKVSTLNGNTLLPAQRRQ